MASWTTPTTRVSLEVIDDADWNTDVTENLKFLYQPPVFHGGTAAGQTITHDTITAINFGTEGFKRDITHSTSSDTHKVTINTAGIYLVIMTGLWATNAAGRRAAFLYKNNAQVDWASNNPNTTTGEVVSHYANIHAFAAADYIEARFYQNSGSSLLVTPDFKVTWVSGP